MKIEKAKSKDNAILSDIALKGKSFWGYEIEQLNEWKDDLTITPNYIEDNDVYKLVVEFEIVGFFSFLTSENNTLKLDYFFIYRQYIGKGLGKVLLNKAIEVAIEKKALKIILDADPNAESFYKHSGFKTYAQLESSVKNRFLPQMELVLN